MALANPFFRACALPRIKYIDFGADDEMLRDEGDAHAAREVGAKARAVVAADVHGGEDRTKHQAATNALGERR